MKLVTDRPSAKCAIGTEVPREVGDRFEAHAIERGIISKSALLRELVEGFVGDQRSSVDRRDLEHG